jgi:hypothetical protein
MDCYGPLWEGKVARFILPARVPGRPGGVLIVRGNRKWERTNNIEKEEERHE